MKILHLPRGSRSLLGHGVARRKTWGTCGPRMSNRAPRVPAQFPDEMLRRQEEEQRRQAELEKDLQLARDIQQGMLLAAVPYLPGWEFSAVSLPARDLGGDLYDFLPLQNGQQAIMIGDVSGKGLQAALRMAVARTLFRYEARHASSPAATLTAINRGVCADIPQGMVTMLYATLDPLQGIVQVANAGHTYPLRFNATVQEFELPGIPLGVDPDIEYEEEVTIAIAPGESLFLYTDGVDEAMSVDEQMFGYERLEHLLRSSTHLRPRTLMKRILNELRAWSAGNVQSDDITMVIVRRRFSTLGRELRIVATDVVGEERLPPLWGRIGEFLGGAPEEADGEDWSALLPQLPALMKGDFSRGLIRELSQEFRLTIEEYRNPLTGGDSS